MFTKACLMMGAGLLLVGCSWMSPGARNTVAGAQATTIPTPVMVSVQQTDGSYLIMAQRPCPDGTVLQTLPEQYNNSQCPDQSAVDRSGTVPPPMPTSPVAPATLPQTGVGPATGCPPARRLGDADDKILTVPTGWVYTVESWYPVTGLLVFGEGQQIQGYRGALWGYVCTLELVLQVEQEKNPVVMQNNQPVSAPTAANTPLSPTSSPTPISAHGTPPATAGEVCPQATRNGNADGQNLIVPAGHTYVVEAWSPETGLMVFAAGKQISGWKGALWDYACSLDAAVNFETSQGKSPIVK